MNAYNDSRALVPYKKPSSLKDSKSRTRARAIQELERIQKLKQEKEMRLAEQEQKLRIASAKRRQKARVEIEKRKFELGVADKVAVVPTLALIHDTSIEQVERRSFKPKAVTLIDLNEGEEDRDTKPINEVLRKYTRLWKNLFSKYQNIGFTHMKKITAKSFDTLHSQAPTLSLAEITKMLKDHDTLPQLISKDELNTLVRMINMKIDS